MIGFVPSVDTCTKNKNMAVLSILYLNLLLISTCPIQLYSECIYYYYHRQQHPAYINTSEEAFACIADASFDF
jgi:hypothetical protein